MPLTTGKSKISVGGNETDKKIYFILSVRENRQENYKTDRKMVNVLSVYVTDRKIGNTLSVFLVHTEKIIYFLSGTDYFCRYFSNTQENYEKKSTRQNLAQSEHPAPSENPKNPVQRQKEKKKAHSSYVIHSSLHLPCKQEAGAVQPCWWWPVGSCIDFDRLHPCRIPDESRPPRAADQEQPWTVLQRCCRTTVAADVLQWTCVLV